MDEVCYAVDIGGTSIKLGLVTSSGSVICRGSVKTIKDMPLQAMVNKVSHQLKDMAEDAGQHPKSIGICAPGYPDPRTGVLIDGSGAVPSLRTGSISRALSSSLGVPAGITNDGASAAHGERVFGVGRHCSSFILMCIGTGIGGAVVHDGRILEGSNGEPPEFGAITVRPNEGRSKRGRQGSIEDLAGARAMIEAYRLNAANGANCLSADDLRQRALDGDKLAQKIFDDATDYLAQALGMIVNTTCVTNCVIGGGVSNAGDFLIKPIQQKLPRYTWKLFADKVNVQVSELGSDAGLVGTTIVPRFDVEEPAAKFAQN